MKNLLDKARTHLQELFEQDGARKLLFHNWKLKETLLSKGEELVKECDLSKEEGQQTLLALLFLNTYLLFDDTNKASDIDRANSFLTEQEFPSNEIEKVEGLIDFIHKRKTPETMVEKVLSDLHQSYISEKSFPTLSELWREERQHLEGKKIPMKEWRKNLVEKFRLNHRFHTDYANENWVSRKKKNLKKLVKAKKKDKKLVRKEKLKAKFKGKIADRGIQTLYRVTLRNHIKLSDIADTKANILLSVNAIIISLSLANLVPKLDNPSNDYLIYPTFIFVIFCIVSMVMSIMATRPNVTSGEFTKEDVKAKKVNLLFFGNFHKMKLDSYDWAMNELIKDRDYIYSSLTMDLYYLGVVLERKYRLLRWTYTVFMIGMIVSVIVFGVALKYFGPERVLPDLPQ